MTQHPGNNPRFFQLYQDIRGDILLGELAPGSRLPTTQELNQKYSVSNGTMAKALELLERGGLIDRRQGLGLFVSADVDQALQDARPEIERPAAPEGWRVQVLKQDWKGPPQRVRRIFQGQAGWLENGALLWGLRLAVEETNLRRRKLTEFFAPAWAARLAGAEDGEQAMPWALAQRLCPGQPLTARQVIRPWVCPGRAAGHLGLEEGTACLHRAITYLLDDGRVLLYAETLMTHNSYQIETRIHFPRTPAPERNS